jgi:hypothetical protein
MTPGTTCVGSDQIAPLMPIKQPSVVTLAPQGLNRIPRRCQAA